MTLHGRTAPLLLVLMLSSSLSAQEVSKVATTMAGFLKLDVGPRAAALGGAYVALADDASTLAWNPAGMSAVGKPSLTVSRAALYAGISHSYVGYVQPVGRSSFVGLSAIYLNSGEMEVTTIEYDKGLDQQFTVTDVALGLSYARRMTDFLTVGATVKVIQEKIFREAARTIAFDIGSYFDTGVAATIFGMSVSNFGSDMKLDGPDLETAADVDDDNQGNRLTPVSLKTERWPLPLIVRMGIRTDLLGGINAARQMGPHRLSLLVNASDPVDHFIRLHLGLEYVWGDILFLRMGKKINGLDRSPLGDDPLSNRYKDAFVEFPLRDETGALSLDGLAFGFGIRYSRMGMDYALSNFGLLEYVHQVGINMSFQ